jgi:kinesin family protein 5
VVVVNEELTAEEWKRRYEKEKEKIARIKGALAKAEAELEKWRHGETVSPEEQIRLKLEEIDSDLPITYSESNLVAAVASSSIAASTKANFESNAAFALLKEDWEREKTTLYSQLDEKVTF